MPSDPQSRSYTIWPSLLWSLLLLFSSPSNRSNTPTAFAPTCAQVLFVLCFALSIPCTYFEFHSLKVLKDIRIAQIQRFSKAGQQEQSDRQEGSRQILAKGILAFSEP
jgi:hypothetical protein